MNRRAVLDVTEMPAEAQRAAIEACALSGVEPVRWERREPLGVAPDVLVAGLPAGARRIPEPVMDLIARTAPHPPLLVLCEDALVRSTYELHEGRVTLVARPFTAARISSQLSVLLAGPDFAHHELARRADGDAVTAHARVAAHAWLGGIVARGRDIPPAHVDDESVTLLLAPGDDATAPSPRLDAARDIAQSSASSGEKRVAFEELLGRRTCVVHLGERGRRWICYWPEERAPLVLFSEGRLPATCNLEQRSGLVTLEARAGDLLAAFSAGAGPWLGPAERARMSDGGPALLRALGEASSRTNGPGTALVVGVRW